MTPPPALPETLETPRLVLRPWALGDVDAVYAYARDEEWSRFLHMLPRPYTRLHAEQFVARQVLLDRAMHPSWAITLEGIPGGGVNLRMLAEHRLAEMGYSVAREQWGRGIGTEAAGAVLDAAFGTWPELRRVRAFADARNAGSRRVMEKLGMAHEGVLRQNRVERGEVVDEAWYGILRPEWEAGPAGPSPAPDAAS